MNFLQTISQTGSPRKFKKGEHVFRQGDDNCQVYVIRSGILKAYYLSESGKEHVKSLLQAGSFIGSMTACHSKSTCSFNLMCLEDSELLSVSFDTLKSMAAENTEIAQFLINALLDLAMKKERREYELLCISAEERFTLLREQSPELLDRVTQNDIARYLGVTPVALSRIKSRV